MLFVDDEPHVLSALKRTLRAMERRWDMEFVNSGAQALRQLSRDSVDALVTDMAMPGMTGAELLCNVFSRNPDLRPIVLSGHVSQASVQGFFGDQCRYLAKPCAADALIAAIEECLAPQEHEFGFGAANDERTAAAAPIHYRLVAANLLTADERQRLLGDLARH
ncbi:MAG: response regulator [Rhodospirillales bacterium]|nr:response regulator [Rhodospirillales bacterium]